MSTIQFNRISEQYAIFKATPISGGAAADADQPQVIFLTPGRGHGQTLSLDDSWLIGSGRYIFLDQPLADPDTFAENFWASNPPAGVRFAWIRNPNENTSNFIGPRVSLGTQNITNDSATFSFEYATNTSLSIGPGCSVTLDSQNDRFIIGQPAGNQAAYLKGNQGTPLYAVGQEIYLPLAGTSSGCLQFQVSLTESDMDDANLDVGCRYYVDDPANQGKLLSQQYPIFSLPGGAAASLMMSVDIFDAFNTSRTYLSFTAEAGSNQTVTPSAIGSYFRTNTGQGLSLTAHSDALLIFAVNAQSVPPGQADPLYLVPQGQFNIAPASSAQSAGDTGPAVRFMCGLAGTEYFGLGGSEGNALLFTPGSSAYAPYFWTPSSTATALLASDATTSWASLVPPALAEPSSAGTGASALGYYAQPAGAELFAAGFPAGGSSTVGGADASKASFLGFQEMTVPLQSAAASPLSPIAPYAGVTPLMVQQPSASEAINLAVALETQVISPYRRQLIGNGGGSNGAAARAAGDTPANNATTPQGFLANVSSSAWNTLTLGQGDSQEQVLTLQNISTELQSALQTNQQFLVVSVGAVLDYLNSVISIGGWTFDLSGETSSVNDPAATASSFAGASDLSTTDGFYNQSTLTFTSGALMGQSSQVTSYAGATRKITVSPAFTAAPANGDEFEISVYQNGYTNVLIFKFYNDTIKNLAANTSVWAGKGTPFNFNVASVSSFLQQYISDAEDQLKAGNVRFQSFVELVNDPGWNGVLALNVKIPVNQLPQEVQGLIGGMNLDKFSAHHFGIETNTIGSDFSLEKSSLFALINYDNTDSTPAATGDSPPLYDFKVLTLQVVFANSEITDFSSQIAVTINQLFDEPASLDTSSAAGDGGQGQSNTIILNGSYEDHDGVSTYSFVAAGSYVFDIESVIFKSIELTKVQFTTVTSDDSSGDISSSFSFWGKITFGSFLNFDLFSFDDLYFADLSLSFTFNPATLGSGGIPIQNFTFDPGNLRFDVSVSQARQDSLLGKFPLRLLGFTYASAGVTISDLGYTPLDVPLIKTYLNNSSPMTFALTFSLDLGSIGGLATPLKGFAANLVAGWTPASGATGTNVAVGFKLPESSGGKLQIGIEGVLLLTIDNFLLTDITQEAELAGAGAAEDSSPYYVIYLNGCMLDVLGTQVPPGGTFEFLFFVPQGQGASSALSNLGWYVAYQGTEESASQATGGQTEGDEGGGPLLKLAYLGLGQRVQLPEGIADAQTVSDVLEAMSDQLAPAATDPDKLKAQLAEIYNKDKDWIVGGKFTILETLTLGAVYYDPSTYGMLIGIAPGKLGPLGGFNFEILYKKVTDTIGVYQIQLTLPDALRQLQFGEVSITLPVIGIDIYTNGNFKIDVGFPVGLDFSNSLSVQVFPFVGFGGFYYAQLSSATATNVQPPPAGSFNPILEFGFALSLGVGKTIDQGIFKAGLTVTFVGILEGVVAYWVPPGESSGTEVMFNRAPDYYVITGQIAIVGNLYGVVNFGIVKASVSLTISAGAGLTWVAYDDIVLSIYASVKVAVTVVIGGFKIFGHTIEIKISFSFSTTISYSWTIPDNRTPPWAGYVSAAEARVLGAAEQYQPITWTPVKIYANPQPAELYFSPQVTVTVPQPGGQPQAQFVALLTINTAPLTGTGFSDFDYLASALLGWTINQYMNPDPSTYNPALQVAATDMNNLSTQLSDPSTPPLDYTSLGAFLAENFVASITDVPTDPTGDSNQQTTIFPMVPNLTLTATGQQPTNFDSTNMVPDSYLGDISQYFAQLLVNFDAGQSQQAVAATDTAVSMATVIFQDYFLLIIKAAAGKAADYLTGLGKEAALGDLLTALQQSPNQYADVAGQAGRFLLHGLQLPEEFPDTDPSQWNDLVTYPLYGLVGQQVPLVPDVNNNYSASLAINPNATPQSWVVLQTQSSVSGGTPTTTIFDGGQGLSDVDDTYVSSTLTFTSGALKGMSSTISAYAGATRQITVGTAFSAAPAVDDQFVIAVQPTATMDSSQVGTITDLVTTYSTYQPVIAVSQLPNLVQQPASYTLQRPTPLTFTPSETAWTIWPFPTTLMDQLANTEAPAIELVLKQGAIGQTQSSPAGVDYNWATIINLSAQQVPTGGGFLTNSYQIGGADETGRNLLDSLINLGAAGVSNVVAGVYLLFNPPSSGSTPPGLNAASNLNASATAVLKINLSTESAPPSEGALAMPLAETQAPADQYSAAMNQYYYFFKLIWECSIVNAGGYYLYYLDDSGNGLPSYLFDGGKTTDVSLLITFNSGQQVAPYNNCVVTTSSGANSLPRAVVDPDQSTVFYAESTNLLAWHAALEAGSVGFSLTCSDPTTTYTMPSNMALSADRREGLRREDVIAALASEGIDGAHPDYWAMMNVAGDQEINLMNLFNLLTYQTGDYGDFEQSMQGLPVGPINTTGAVSDPAPQANSFYANIGIAATNDFYDGSTITFTGGALSGQSATIAKYTATTQQIVLSAPLTQAPANGDTFDITSTTWYYQQAVSAYRWYKTGNQAQNEDPYAGVGGQVVLEFQLRDLFGNALVPATPLPQLTANYLYFDDLIPVTAWPGVQASYLCASEAAQSNLNVTLSFESSTFMPAVGGSVNDAAATATSFVAAQGLASADNYYDGSLITFTSGALSGETRTISQYTAATSEIVVSEAFSAAPANGDKFTITVIDDNRIQQGVETYQKVGFQLGSQGVSITMSTSLDPTEQPALPLGQLQTFVGGIIDFLNGLLKNPQSPQPPAPFVFTWPIPLAKREANANNIFEVTVTVSINREPTLVDPSVRSTPAGAAPSLALSASAAISPLSQWDEAASTVGAGAITAASFTAAGLSSIDGFYNGAVLTFAGGALSGLSSTVSGYDGASGLITVSPAFAQPPAAGDAFTIAPKNGLVPFAQEFENAFPEMRAATGLGEAGPTSIFAVRIGVIQQGNNGINVQINSDSPAYFAPKPLSNTLLSRPDAQNGPVGVIKYASGGPASDATGTVGGSNPAPDSFSATVSPSSGAYAGGILTFTSGALNGQYAMITAYSEGQISVAPEFTQAPAVNDTFKIFAPVATTFQDVDLDVFSRAFVSAVDQFLSPAIAVPARQINPTDYRRVMMAKEALAEEISLGVTWVLEGDSGVGPTALEAAQDAFKQRLLVSLASDYDIDTIVQYTATVTTKGVEETVPPNLYGQVIEEEIVGAVSATPPPTASSFAASGALSATDGFYVGSTLVFTSGSLAGQSSGIIDYVGSTRTITVDPAFSAPPAATDSFEIVQPDFNLSTAKLPLSTAESLITFLFDTKVDTQASVALDMQYKVTHIEHDISSQSVDGYTSSSWLTLITSNTDPATGEPAAWPGGNVMPVGEANIPVPLRAYPTPPTLTNQNAIAGASETATGNGSDSLLAQRKWHYECQYQQLYIAQDTVGTSVEFNVPQSSGLAAFAEIPGHDLFYWLARFSVEYPQMAADVAAIQNAQPGNATAYYAIQRFADLVWGAAYDLTPAPPAPEPPPDPSSGPWALWVNDGNSVSAARSAIAFQTLSQYEYKYHVEQSDPTISRQEIKLTYDLSPNAGDYSFYQSPVAQSTVSDASPTASGFTGGAGLSAEDGAYTGCVLSFTTGALAGQASAITSYTGASRTIEVAPAFAQAPANGDQFSIGQIPFPDIAVEIVASSVSDTPAPQAGTFAGGQELSPNDNAYNGYLLTFTTGSLSTQSSKVTAYTGSTRTLTVDPALPAAPAAGDQFEIDQVLQPDTQQEPLAAIYQFTNPNPSNELTRTLVFDNLDIMGTENAWAGIQLARNLILVEGEQTNPLFVYQTPVVRFVNKVTPLIDSSNPVDIAQIISSQVTGTSSTASSFAGSTELSTEDGFYIGGVVTFTSGALAGQSSTVTGYTGATQTLEVVPAFSLAPNQGDAFIIDVDKPVQPQTKTLVDHLSSLFMALFASTGQDTSAGERTVRVACGYEYDVRGGIDTDGSNPIMVSLPVMVVPPFSFDLATDASANCGGSPQPSFVCEVARSINTWFTDYANPATQGGRFVFDISIFASLTATNLPVLRLRDVYLEYQYIELPLYNSGGA